MNQSAIRTLCSLLVLAASATHAESADSSLPTKAQVVREWSAGIRSNAIRASKEIHREAIKTALTPAALTLEMPELEMPMLSDSSEVGYPVAMVTRTQAVSPHAD